MKKAEELRDPMSCLNRAADDEPLFVLRANDPLAANIVSMWARDYLAMKDFAAKLKGEPGATDAHRKKCEEALTIAADMHEWQRRGE